LEYIVFNGMARNRTKPENMQVKHTTELFCDDSLVYSWPMCRVTAICKEYTMDTETDDIIAIFLPGVIDQQGKQ